MKKAFVDEDTCIGCGMCEMTCPSVFHLTDNGTAEAYKDVEADEAGEVQDAIDGCPVSAISWKN